MPKGGGLSPGTSGGAVEELSPPPRLARSASLRLGERLKPVEATLAALGKEAAAIDGAPSDPRLYARATARRAAAAREVEALETEWPELQERLKDAA